jgi:hypothetical protein
MTWMNRLAKKKGNKYGAKETICSAGHPHPSGLEAAVCELLILREKAGDIRNLKYQETLHLAYGVKWKVDWSFEQGPNWIPSFAEAKGKDTADFRLKLRMFKEGCGKGPLELWRGTHRRPYLEKMIHPKEKEWEK